MAIDYNSLKRITGSGIVDGSLTSSDIGNSQITGAKLSASAVTATQLANTTITSTQIATGAVGSSEIATNAVVLQNAAVTGTLPVTKGGTGRTSLGSANTTLKVNSNSTAYEYVRSDLSACRVYTSNGTWTKPAGVTRIRVQLVGGGGGGSGHGEAGGAGGYAEEILNVTSISSVAITIGGGGGGVTYHNQAGNGATTSFGPYLSAGGGEGGRRVGGYSGGRPGIGSGGNMNLYGGGGAGHTNHGGGEGGGSYFGGSSIGVHNSSPQVSDQESRAAPGTGGTGGPRAIRRGGTGRGGIVIVWEYK